MWIRIIQIEKWLNWNLITLKVRNLISQEEWSAMEQWKSPKDSTNKKGNQPRRRKMFGTAKIWDQSCFIRTRLEVSRAMKMKWGQTETQWKYQSWDEMGSFRSNGNRRAVGNENGITADFGPQWKENGNRINGALGRASKGKRSKGKRKNNFDLFDQEDQKVMKQWKIGNRERGQNRIHGSQLVKRIGNRRANENANWIGAGIGAQFELDQNQWQSLKKNGANEEQWVWRGDERERRRISMESKEPKRDIRTKESRINDNLQRARRRRSNEFGGTRSQNRGQ